MERVFISSIQRGYSDVRSAVARAVESSGMRPVMAETEPAAATSAKAALLEQVRSSHAMILIVGARYGDPGPNGRSPTEDEFNEAVANGKPVLTLVQNIDRDPKQDEFLGRVRGSWGEGSLTASFDDVRDAELKAMQALARLARAASTSSLRPQAEEQALALARVQERGSLSVHGSSARVVIVPVMEAQLIDDATLNRGAVADQLIVAARDIGLISQRLGVELSSDGRAGIVLQAGASHSEDSVSITVGRQGAIVAEVSVAGDGHFGSTLIDPDRLKQAITTTGAFATRVWQTIDESQRIGEASMTIGIPNASMRVYGRATGSTMSYGGAMQLPQHVVAPDPPASARRAEIGTSALADRLAAAVERVFRDAQAVNGM
jgi:Domain of unknown function (DUF4062)